MRNSSVVIHCWLQVFRGQGFVVRLVEKPERGIFLGLRQNHADIETTEACEQGLIDEDLPSHAFTAPRELVHTWLKELQKSKIDLVPAQMGAGMDGSNFHLTLVNGDYSFQFCWWQDCPASWDALDALWHRIVALSEK